MPGLVAPEERPLLTEAVQELKLLARISRKARPLELKKILLQMLSVWPDGRKESDPISPKVAKM